MDDGNTITFRKSLPPKSDGPHCLSAHLYPMWAMECLSKPLQQGTALAQLRSLGHGSPLLVAVSVSCGRLVFLFLFLFTQEQGQRHKLFPVMPLFSTPLAFPFFFFLTVIFQTISGRNLTSHFSMLLSHCPTVVSDQRHL